MSWQKQRLVIGIVSLVGLVALAAYLVRTRTGDTVASADESASLPDLDKSKIDALVIRRAEGDTVELAKRGGAWRVTAPVDASADQSAIDTVLDRLDELSSSGIAAENAASHAKLEVADDNGVQVTVRGEGKDLAKLVIGAYRGGSTMVRLAGESRVHSVNGSLKYAFNKEVRDWRDRSIVDVSPADLKEATFRVGSTGYHFVRGEGDAWMPAPDQTAIEKFEGNQVQSVVSSLSRLRASDFAAADTTAEAAGLTSPAATVTLVPKEGAPIVIELGGTHGSGEEHYARRAGNDTIYVVTKFLADRLAPTVDKFQQSEAPSGAGATPPPDPMGGAGGSPQIPPEVMQQLQRQLQQQAPH